jgi:F-type H+-transporting ATPase subunit a
MRTLTKFLQITLLALFLAANPIFADKPEETVATQNATDESHHEKKKFNAGELILEHVSDSHEWHVMTLGGGTEHERHISLPLPCIVKHPTQGWIVFLSSNFVNHETHQEQEYEALKMDEKQHIVVAASGEKVLDLSITKNVFALLISLIIMCAIFLSVAKTYTRRVGQAPTGLQSFVEPLIVFLRDEVAKPSIGPKYERYLPFLLTIFFFIFINNLMGLIPILPGGANVTGNIAITMVLALMVFFITTFSVNKAYWIHIINTPGVPWWLKFPVPLMPIIELVGVVSKPLVLCLRLFANITAGHIIALAFFSLIFIFGEANAGVGYGVSVVSVAFTIFMNFLELLVAFLQAYVFTLLASLYFGSAVEEHAHHDDHH